LSSIGCDRALAGTSPAMMAAIARQVAAALVT
jgi:hypothetical protein